MIQLTENDIKYLVKECLNRLYEDTAYHGSNSLFNNFDSEYIKLQNGENLWGYGTYLTKNKNYAKAYGEHIYTVEIPDDNGNNYIYAHDEIGQELSELIIEELYNYMVESEPESYSGDSVKAQFINELESQFPYYVNGIDMYGNLCAYFGSDTEASEFCYNRLNKIGIKYMDGNTENILMFNNNDTNIINGKSLNNNLNRAKVTKNDEFYTHEEDIEKELFANAEFFRGKVVYCNCDDPRKSNFFKFFVKHFNDFGLKYLYSSGYYDGKRGVKGEYDGNEVKVTEMEGNGDFRSEESRELLDKCDIVVTNPPFSLTKQIIPFLDSYGKYYYIISSINACTYKEIMPLIRDGKLWLGNNWVKSFVQPDGEIKKFGNICWYTNFPIDRTEHIKTITMRYDESFYERYDNFDAINVRKVKEIPYDYNGIMGVPIGVLFFLGTDGFIHFTTPENKDSKYKILGKIDSGKTDGTNLAKPIVNGKELYKKIAIQKVK